MLLRGFRERAFEFLESLDLSIELSMHNQPGGVLTLDMKCTVETCDQPRQQ